MQNSKSSSQSSSASSLASNRQNSTSVKDEYRLPSDFEYLGRLITHERPIIRKSNSSHEKFVFPSNTLTSSDEDIDDLNKLIGVIRINDRHFREIYRLPTPPPQIKRVFHRLHSPEPKIIEQVFVRRPRQEIIENIIEVPPEKVRIINKEKYLRKSKPIIRTKVVHLKSHNHHQNEDYPSPVTYTQSTIPPHMMFDSQQFFNLQPIQAPCYALEPSQIPLNYFPEYSQYYS